jgi:hypothetical protein
VNGSGAPELDNLTMTIVKHGRAAALQANGQTQRIALPAARRQFGSPAEMLDLARYVTSVSVERSEYDGRSADKIVGKLDTHALLGSAGLASKLLEGAGVHFGDIRAVLYIPRDTHLVEVMFADLDVQGGGQTAHLHLSIATRDVNKPLAIPQL